MTSPLPLALIDVDGVLNPYAAPACPTGYREHELFAGEVVRVNLDHGALLDRLARHFELVWATMWAQNANRLLSPLLGLATLPFVEFPPHSGGHYSKFPVIAEYVGDRACAWIDDIHDAAAHDWADERPDRLLITADPAVGLTAGHIHQMIRFAGELRGMSAPTGTGETSLAAG